MIYLISDSEPVTAACRNVAEAEWMLAHNSCLRIANATEYRLMERRLDTASAESVPQNDDAYADWLSEALRQVKAS